MVVMPATMVLELIHSQLVAYVLDSYTMFIVINDSLYSAISSYIITYTVVGYIGTEHFSKLTKSVCALKTKLRTCALSKLKNT